jgi:hypothetical protein
MATDSTRLRHLPAPDSQSNSLGETPVEQPGAQVMIFRDQNDKRGVSFAGLVDGLAQKFESVKEGGAKASV